MRKVPLLALLVTFAPGCFLGGSSSSDDDANGGGGAAPGAIASSIEDAIAQGGAVGDPAPEHPARPEGAPLTAVDKYADGSEWDCTVQKMSIQENPAAFVALQPTTGIIYPGALLQGSTLLSDDIRPIAVKRGGGQIVYDVVVGGGARDVQRSLSEVTFGNVVQAQDELLTQLNDTSASVPALLSSSIEVFDSTDELAAAMHLSAKLLGASFKASLDFSNDHRVSRVVGQLTQTYFSVKFERPTAVRDFFGPDVTPAELASFVGKGNPATYVDTVTYGRRAYFIVESDASKQELKAAVEAKFSGNSVDASIDVTHIAKNSSLRFVAMGGPSAAVLDALARASNSAGDGQTPTPQKVNPGGGKEIEIAPANGESPLDTFKRYLANPDAWVFSKSNPPVPISYIVRNVTDDRIVKMDAGTEYSTRACNPRIGPTKAALSLDASKATFDGNGNLTAWPSALPTVHAPSTFQMLSRDDLNGHQAIHMARPYASARDMDCGFLVNNDYTMAFVARSKRDYSSTEMFFTSGLDRGETGRYMYIGWSSDGGDKLSVGHLNADQQFAYNSTGSGAVIVVTFQKGSGFSAWANDVELPKNGTHGDPTTPFTGASACAVGTTEFDIPGRHGYPGAVGAMGEVRGYRGVLTKAERQVVECELAAKWGIEMGAACMNGKPAVSF